MRKLLLFLLVMTSTCFADTQDESINPFFSFASVTQLNYCKPPRTPLSDIKKLLYAYSDTLNKAVINTVLTTIQCAQESDVHYNNILTIIDYSLPSNKKRLWIFDLQNKKLLFYTYVSHGIKSGTLETTYFSNKLGGQASSLGIFTTEETYNGRHGLSLKLAGLERSFNDTALQRDIVMHGAWYVNQDFVDKYGRIGRSWGCPAIPLDLVKPIINAIKDQNLLVVYYPSYDWLLKSKFLNCRKVSLANNIKDLKIMPDEPTDDFRGAIPFVDKHNNNKHDENDPVLVMSADNYQQIFQTSVPLERMLRQQINNTEYIVLNDKDLTELANHNNYDEIRFVIPNVINIGGNFVTQFLFVNLGKIEAIRMRSNELQKDTIYFSDKSAVNLSSTGDFIRWIGL